jgi:hypothetical protein
MSSDERNEPRVGGMSVGLCFDLSRLYASEAKYVTDPVERDRLLAISRMLEDNGLALIQWRNACSKG